RVTLELAIPEGLPLQERCWTGLPWIPACGSFRSGTPAADRTSESSGHFRADTTLSRHQLAWSAPNACRSRPLIPSLQIKLDPLPFSQSVEVQPLFHAGTMEKDFLSVLTPNESEPAISDHPLNGSVHVTPRQV